MRTKKYNKFKDDVCKSVQVAVFTFSLTEINGMKAIAFSLEFDNKPIDINTLETIAINDGFDNILEFGEWFYDDFCKNKSIVGLSGRLHKILSH